MTTTQAIPDYVYMEVADQVAKQIKTDAEKLIVEDKVRVGGRIKITTAFTLTLNVLNSHEKHPPVAVNFE